MERIYGIHQGNGSNQYEQNPKLSDNAKTQQEELAKEIGISVQNLQNYKMLADMIPDIDDLVQAGIVTNRIFVKGSGKYESCQIW